MLQYDYKLLFISIIFLLLSVCVYLSAPKLFKDIINVEFTNPNSIIYKQFHYIVHANLGIVSGRSGLVTFC